MRRTFLQDALSFWYLGALIFLLLISAGMTFMAQDRAAYMRAGAVMKAAMVMAVAYGALVARSLDA
ncbi:MAG: hypothetical protein IPH53_15620 [Flavobacteriales bacterium]|nr:hypothetical protein [Flavobacteriales bacterium]